MILGFSLILALFAAQGGPLQGARSARDLLESASYPPTYNLSKTSAGDPLCNSRLIELGAQVVQQAGLPALTGRSGLGPDQVVDGPSVLLPTLNSVPESLRADLIDADAEAEQWFRFFLSSARIPYSFHFGDRAGHSYADIGSQEQVLSSMVPQRQVRVARSLLLRFIHLWDDFVDMIEEKPSITRDITKSAESLMFEHEPRIYEVWKMIDAFIKDRLSRYGYDAEAMLFGIQRTAYASLMFSTDVEPQVRRSLRAGYKIRLMQRLPENSRMRRFLGSLSERYVAYTSKVLLEAFDGPFVDFYPRRVRDNFRGLSYLMELLYVPALVKQNESHEIQVGETARRARLDDQEAGETLMLVMNKIKSLPVDQRRFVVRNLPLFVEKYEMILKKKKVWTAIGKRPLYDVYKDFMENDAIQPLVSAEVIYQEVFLYRLRIDAVKVVPMRPNPSAQRSSP